MCCVFQDLKYIYGRYIDPSSEEEKNMCVKKKKKKSNGVFPSAQLACRLTRHPHPSPTLQLFLTLAICHFPLRVFSNSCRLRAALLISTYPDHEGLLPPPPPYRPPVHQQHFKCTLHLSHQAPAPVPLIKWTVHGHVLSSWFLFQARQTVCLPIADD